MKKKTVYILLGTAAIGGAIWYLRAKKNSEASKAFVDYVQNGSPTFIPVKGEDTQPVPQVIKDLLTNPFTPKVEPVYITPAYTAPVATQPAPAYSIPKQTPYSKPPLNYLAQRQIALAGILF